MNLLAWGEALLTSSGSSVPSIRDRTYKDFWTSHLTRTTKALILVDSEGQ